MPLAVAGDHGTLKLRQRVLHTGFGDGGIAKGPGEQLGVISQAVHFADQSGKPAVGSMKTHLCDVLNRLRVILWIHKISRTQLFRDHELIGIDIDHDDSGGF